MIRLLRHFLGWLIGASCREGLILENLALRQQLITLHGKRPRPRLNPFDKLFRRKILHFNVTRNPDSFGVALQLRQTWGFEQPQRFLIFDRDAKFIGDVIVTVKNDGILPIRTAFRSPWQKAYVSHCTSLVACV